MALSRNITRKDIALPDIPAQPHHPAATFVYPKREFGMVGDFFRDLATGKTGRLDSRTTKPLLLIRKCFRSLLY